MEGWIQGIGQRDMLNVLGKKDGLAHCNVLDVVLLGVINKELAVVSEVLKELKLCI